VTGANSFEDYLASLTPFVHLGAGAEPEAFALCERATAVMADLSPIDTTKLAAAVEADPKIAPVLAAAMGLSQERFKTWLQGRFRTAGWVTLGREHALALIEALDEDFDLIDLVQTQLDRQWTWADVLARVMAPSNMLGARCNKAGSLKTRLRRRSKSLGFPLSLGLALSGRPIEPGRQISLFPTARTL
jgi:hypothetical protein